jgi:transcription initiation factor TFIIIB Brf1 subunit/transcription initiation factor TFIIB
MQSLHFSAADPGGGQILGRAAYSLAEATTNEATVTGGQSMSETRRCEVCGEVIDPERVEVLPETRLCTTHARQIEKLGGEFKVTSHLERTSKEGSLKRNYGGVTTTKRRNHEALRKLRDAYTQEQEQKG